MIVWKPSDVEKRFERLLSRGFLVITDKPASLTEVTGQCDARGRLASAITFATRSGSIEEILAYIRDDVEGFSFSDDRGIELAGLYGEHQ
jgi:hypothetical protein